MRILAIETSCDETSIAVFDANTAKEKTHSFRVLSHVTLSQIDQHRPYGGVYPNLARREHQKNIIPAIGQALEAAGLLYHNKTPLPRTTSFLGREMELKPIVEQFISEYENPEIDLICVTSGPGLEPALWVGINCARALAQAWSSGERTIPVIPCNHMEGHILSVFATSTEFTIPPVMFPALALLISGGHTEFVLMSDWRTYQIIGKTRDDAIGEAYDKTARLLGLPYPGGPEISKLATQFKTNVSVDSEQWALPPPLPRPMIHSGDLDFSFSGLKTAVRYLVDSIPKPLSLEIIGAIAYEFESAVIDVVRTKTDAAIKKYAIETLIVGGGVIANTAIRSALTEICTTQKIPCLFPTRELSTDNALMIGIAGYLKYYTGYRPAETDFTANGNLEL